MAESADNAVAQAEQAPTATAAEVEPVMSGSAEVGAAQVANDQPATSAASAKRKQAAEPDAKKSAKPTSKISKPRRAAARKAKAASEKTAVPSLTELKEKIMATAKTNDFSKPFTEAVGEFQSKAKSAYDKSAALAAEATEFAKGNLEAVVESGKVYAAGVQDLSKTYVEEAKSAYETLTADMKELAAVKSPTELFQLQGKLARRNFDAMVAYGSKNTDAVLKLMSETFAPISGRVSLAAEKISKVA
jgi:phasin family protein